MSIRTTVSLDEDVANRLKEESLARGVPFRTLLNEAVRSGLLAMRQKPGGEPFKVEAVDLGVHLGINYDNIGALIEATEGDAWR